MLPAVGDKVTVVITGKVLGVDEEGGTELIDVDYGPGNLVAVESELLEESPVVKGLVEFARRGVVWNRKGPGGYGWVCPRCGKMAITAAEAMNGGICDTCRERVAESDVTNECMDYTIDFLCDALVDAGLDRGVVWRVAREKRDEVKRDAGRHILSV